MIFSKLQYYVYPGWSWPALTYPAYPAVAYPAYAYAYAAAPVVYTYPAGVVF